MLRSVLKRLAWSTGIVLVATWPFCLNLSRVTAGYLPPESQLHFWLSWQIFDNIKNLRLPWDASILEMGGPLSLLNVAGWPGVAWLSWPLQLLHNPLLAWNLSLFLILVLNTFGASLLFRGRRGLWAAVAIGAAGWWGSRMAQGDMAAILVGPALAAIGTSTRQMRGAWMWAALGALLSPLLTALILLGARLWEARSPVKWGVVSLVLAILLPPIVAAPLHLPLSGLAWPSVQTAAPPLWVLLGILLSQRWQQAGFLCLFALACGPWALDMTGQPLVVEGFALPISPDIPSLAAYQSILASVGIVLSLFPLLARAEQQKLPQPWLIMGFLLLEPHLQAWVGQPVTLSSQATLDVPAAFSQLAQSPRSGLLLGLPLKDVAEGGVFWIPYHRQRILGGPLHSMAAQTQMQAYIAQDPLVGTLHNQYALSPDTVLNLREQRFAGIVLYGSDPSYILKLARGLGPPDWKTAVGYGWDRHIGMGPTGPMPNTPGLPPPPPPPTGPPQVPMQP